MAEQKTNETKTFTVDAEFLALASACAEDNERLQEQNRQLLEALAVLGAKVGEFEIRHQTPEVVNGLLERWDVIVTREEGGLALKVVRK